MCTVNGKLNALPMTNSSIDNSMMMWVRQDWLDTLGVKAPTTISQLTQLMNDFAQKNPGGSEGNIYGLAANKLIFGGDCGLDGFFQAFHAYPNQWINVNGKLVNGNTQPAMKAALQQLADYYKAGLIDPEFAVKDEPTEDHLIASGNIGVEFGQMWNPLYPLNSSVDNNKKADWVAYPLPSSDGQPVKPGIATLGTSTFYVVSSKCKYPEAAVNMMNLFVQKGWNGTNADYNTYFDNTYKGQLYQTFKMSAVQAWPATKNLDIYFAINNAITTKNTSKLNPEQLTNYKTVTSFLDKGDTSGWGMYRVFGPGGAFRTVNQYYSNKQLVMNAFYGPSTPTMASKGQTLNNLLLQEISAIIMGQKPVSDWDNFVKTYNALGYTAITKEVNAWYATQK